MAPCLITLVLLGFFQGIPNSSAAGASEFSAADRMIQSAFIATYKAEQNGGNVSSLVFELNEAIRLVQKAQAENSTNPLQATQDLQSANQIAENVLSESSFVSKEGASIRETKMIEAVGGAVAVIAAAVLIYIYGDKVYRRIWLFVYRDYVVRKRNE